MTRIVDLRKKTEKKEVIPVVEKTLLIDPVRGKTPLFEGSSADHASEADRTSNGID